MLTEPELLAIIYAFGLGADATVPIGIPHLGYLEQRPATRFSTKTAIAGGNDISATHGPIVIAAAQLIPSQPLQLSLFCQQNASFLADTEYKLDPNNHIARR